MLRLRMQIVAVFLAVQLLGLPLNGDTPGFVGVATVSGSVEINGVQFYREGNVYTGDRVTTKEASVLTLSSGVSERIRLAPESTARFAKHGVVTVVALEQGRAALRSIGQTQVLLEGYGVTIRGKSGIPVIAEILLSDAAGAKVSVLKGPVAVSSAYQSMFLNSGQGALISPGDAESMASLLASAQEELPRSEAGSITATLVDEERTAVQGAQVSLTSETGVSFTTESNPAGAVTFAGLPPGGYNIRITHPRFRTREMSGLRVVAGRELSLGVIVLLRGRGEQPGAGTNTALIVGLVLAGVVGGVVAVVALGGDDGAPSAPMSPSSP